jgi:hypothetical protein
MIQVKVLDYFDKTSFSNIQPLEGHVWQNGRENAEAFVFMNASIGGSIPNESCLLLSEPYDYLSILSGQDFRQALLNMVSKSPFINIFIYDDELVEISDLFRKTLPGTPTWISQEDRDVHVKTKNVSMISSRKNFCSGHRLRVQVADIMKTCQLVDLFGRDFGVPVENKIDCKRDYRFSIVIENQMIPGWHTEKILDCFMTGTIPVYYGDPNIGNYYDTNGILRLEDVFGSLNPNDWDLDNINRLNSDLYDQMKESAVHNFEVACQMDSKYRLPNIINNICLESFQ